MYGSNIDPYTSACADTVQITSSAATRPVTAADTRDGTETPAATATDLLVGDGADRASSPVPEDITGDTDTEGATDETDAAINVTADTNTTADSQPRHVQVWACLCSRQPTVGTCSAAV